MTVSAITSPERVSVVQGGKENAAKLPALKELLELTVLSIADVKMVASAAQMMESVDVLLDGLGLGALTVSFHIVYTYKKKYCPKKGFLT